MADTSVDRDALVSQFCELTGASPDEAETYLASSNWDLPSAATEYYTSQEEAEAVDDENADTEDEHLEADEGEDDEDELAQPSSRGAGRILGDGSTAPTSASASSLSAIKSKKGAAQVPKRGIATLRDLNQGRAHDDDDEDDDGDEEDEKDNGRDLYAGGGKSGLAVKDPADPRKTVRGIIDRAKKNMSAPEEDSPSARTSRFSGTGQTLGGDDAPSRTIPDPNADAPKPRPRVARTLHFWQNGFSVEDGPLYRFDDPQSAPVLALIKSGRAPLHIMGVQADQPVDVTVAQHEEDYVQPKKKYKPFSGGGQRLGAPTPAIAGTSDASSSSTSAPPTAAAQSSITTTSSESARPATVDVDESLPTISLQIRLSDGTRLASRFNTTQTIGDVYEFVRASGPVSAQRPWVLMTTFPSKELNDKNAKLGDLAEFSRGGVMVQKWS